MVSVVVGGGISGIMAALMLAKRGKKVHLIEKADELGGLLRSFNYGEHGKFDYGIHNVLDNNIEEMDDLLFNLFPEDEWCILEKERRDLGGTYFNGRLQTETPYMDLRGFSEELQKKCMGDFFHNLNRTDRDFDDEWIRDANALEVLEHRFGKTIANEICRLPLKKLYDKEPEELGSLATMVTPFERVIMFNEDVIKDFTASNILRGRLAFIDQRDLPLEKSTGRKCYYPKAFGMHLVVDKLQEKLLENNVTIHLDTSLTNVESDQNKVFRVTCEKDGVQFELNEIESFVWSAGPVGLASALNIPFPKLPYDPPKKTAVTHLLVDKPINMAHLYYLYIYDAPFKTFRVIDYANYCPNAVRNGKYPVTSELLLSPDDNNPETLTENSINELMKMGILDDSYEISFKKTEMLPNGFPTPTMNNIVFLDHLREEINKKNIENLISIGIQSEKNLFFQDRVLKDMYKKVTRN